jgi:hypothetical protein
MTGAWGGPTVAKFAENAAHRPLVEPMPIAPIYADGLAEVIIANGRVTYVHYIWQPTYYGDGIPIMERVIIAKVTIPISAIEESRVIAALAWKNYAADADMGPSMGNC